MCRYGRASLDAWSKLYLVNVLVTGAAGSSGRAVGSLLTHAESIESVTLVDRVDGPEDSAVSQGLEIADVTNRRVLEALIDRFSIDLVVNAAGPYRETLMPVLETAIEAGIGYVDMAEGLHETQAAIATSGSAESNGSVCWIGMGAYPGLTNLLARIAADQLDRVSSIAVAAAINASAVVPDSLSVSEMRATGTISAGWQSLLEAAAPPITVFRDGHLIDVDGSAISSLLAPSGDTVSLRVHNHSEPLTLPIIYPTVKDVTTFLGFTPPKADELFRLQARRAATGQASSVDAMLTFMEEITHRRGDYESDTPPGQMWAAASGELDGQPSSVEAWVGGSWATSPRILAETAIAVGDGRFGSSGVHTPEDVVEIGEFLESIAVRAGITEEPLVHQRTTTH
jgi:NAD(P)-dependent dehydrogenase (short-subunit alcohol dehydrogenase family)